MQQAARALLQRERADRPVARRLELAPRLADFDNDGVLEVVQAAGATKGTTNTWPLVQEMAMMNDQLVKDARFWHTWHPGDDIGAEHNPFFVRAKDGRYYDLANKVGLEEPMNSRGIATADVDGDGRLDFAMANQWEPSFFFRNTAPNPVHSSGFNLRLPLGTNRAGRRRRSWPIPPADRGRAFPAGRRRHRHGHLPDGRILSPRWTAGRPFGRAFAGPALRSGAVGQADKLRVDLRWRGVDGTAPSRETPTTRPGWHTVYSAGNARERRQ